MFKVLEEISEIFGVSGNEDRVSDFIGQIFKDSYKIEKDNIGNLICSKNGRQSTKKVAFIVNIDEPGLIVTGVLNDGLITFTTIGNIFPEALLGRRVRFENGLWGMVVTKKHVNFRNKIRVTDLAIDTGFDEITKLKKQIEIGHFAIIEEKLKKVNNKVIGKNLKSRLLCSVMMEAMKEINQTNNDISFLFSVQEELGGRGAKVLSNYIDADIVIGLGVVEAHTKYYKNSFENDLGEGLILTLKEGNLLYDLGLIKKVELTLIKNEIPYKTCICEDQYTCLRAFLNNYKMRELLSLAIPIKYQGTGLEMASMDDAKMLARTINVLIDFL